MTTGHVAHLDPPPPLIASQAVAEALSFDDFSFGSVTGGAADADPMEMLAQLGSNGVLRRLDPTTAGLRSPATPL